MPIYEYRCERGHTFEVMQRIADDALASCSTCGASVQRVFHPVAVHFKGSGFYSTDYGKKGAGVGGDSAKPSENGSAPDSKKSESKSSDSSGGDSSGGDSSGSETKSSDSGSMSSASSSGSSS